MTLLEVLAFVASISAVRTVDYILRQPQSVASAINGTAEFSCSISNGSLQWEIKLNGSATGLYWPFHSTALMAWDINVSYLSQQQSTLFIKATHQNNRTLVRCLSDLQPFVQSAPAILTVYDRPTPPTRLSAVLAGSQSLNISWIPPFSLPGVSTWYAVSVDGNVTAHVVDRSYYAYRYTGTSPCQNHKITVVASNAAGDSDPSEPLVTDSPDVGQFVATPSSAVELNDVNRVTIIFIFKVVTCRSYPLQQLYIELTNAVTNDHLILGPYIPADNNSYEIHASGGLQPDMKYIYTITAVNMVGNSTTSAQIVYTTDVQSSTVTGSDHQLNVTCFFAEGTLAKGCVVYLEKSGEVAYQRISRINGTAEGVIKTQFSVDCYNISVVDWEEDGSIGSLGVPVNRNTSTSCLDTTATSSFEELVYIIAGVTIVVGIIAIAALLVTIGFCCRLRLTKQAELAGQGPQSSAAHQNGHHSTANTFASDPVYSSSILYMGEIATTQNNKLANGKVAAGGNLSQQWAARLAPPTSTGSSSLDYSKLDRQFQSPAGAKRLSFSSSTSNPLPVFSPHPHHHTPWHPHTSTTRDSPLAPAPPMQQRRSSAQAKAVVHEYELPFEQQGAREERRAWQDSPAAFTDV